jgi:hypothetical protein
LDRYVSDWTTSRNVERFEKLLATDLDGPGRATITKLLYLERAKLPRQLPRTNG